MPVDTTQLTAAFGDKLAQLLTACRGEGVEMRPYFGIRTPFEQARLWRQSRTREEIGQKIAWLTARGAPFLAHCLESVGPQNGAHVTNAIPGFSWHQWGEAADCLWVVEGKAEWSTVKKAGGRNGYRVLAEQATALGLDAGGFWKSLKDWPHVQLRRAASPTAVYPVAEIDQAMQQRFA
jgi:hypothetical protein